MNVAFRTLVLAIATLCGMSANAVAADSYPQKAIRIVTSEPGGGNDLAARVLAPALSAGLGQPVIIDNRSTALTAEIVSKAPPDGYTNLITGVTFWLGPLMQNTSYDPVRDFLPVSLINIAPNIVVVHPSVPVTSIRELIGIARAKPGSLNYASGSTGSSSHLAAELFKAMVGINIVRVPYRGNGPALIGLIGGEVQLAIPSAAAVVPQLKSGKLRALAVTSATASALIPDLPTVAASGVPGYESVGRTAMFAPTKTPMAIIKRLNQEVLRILSQNDITQKFLNTGLEPLGSSPERLASEIKAETVRMGKVIRDAGIRAE